MGEKINIRHVLASFFLSRGVCRMLHFACGSQAMLTRYQVFKSVPCCIPNRAHCCRGSKQIASNLFYANATHENKTETEKYKTRLVGFFNISKSPLKPLLRAVSTCMHVCGKHVKLISLGAQAHSTNIHPNMQKK